MGYLACLLLFPPGEVVESGAGATADRPPLVLRDVTSILRGVIIGGRHQALGEGGEGHGIVGLGLGVGDSQLDRAEARVGSRRPWATTRLPSCPMPIASDLHDALWVTFVVQALPAGPQHCHPRARVPVPGCSEVSQPGLPSRLMGCK